MRLILSNPHIHYYGKVISNVIIRKRNPLKYAYFLKYFIKNPNRKVAFFIDGTRSSFNELGIRFKIFSKFFAYLELLAWMLFNRINPFRHRVYFSVQKLNPKEDILFNFSFTTVDRFTKNNYHILFHTYTGPVLTHLTHYLKDTSFISNYLKKIPNNFFVADSDLSFNGYFCHFFPYAKSVYHLPFTFAERFKKTTAFHDRKNKCFAVGAFSIPKKSDKDFHFFFGNEASLHPMRKWIYENKDQLKLYIDSFIPDFHKVLNLKIIQSNDSLYVRWAKRIFPSYLLINFFPNYYKQYFQFDIVQKYNEYRMFICPEENIGLPSVNVFEGMACGTAFIGIDDPMYTQLGMIPGTHYIAYQKDSPSDLKDKIAYYQAHPEHLERIAQKGYDFVQRFREKNVADIFWTDLLRLTHSMQTNSPKLLCSFISRPLL